jgi:hypothetical protein
MFIGCKGTKFLPIMEICTVENLTGTKKDESGWGDTSFYLQILNLLCRQAGNIRDVFYRVPLGFHLPRVSSTFFGSSYLLPSRVVMSPSSTPKLALLRSRRFMAQSNLMYSLMAANLGKKMQTVKAIRDIFVL